MPENDVHITGIGQTVLGLLNFKLGQGITSGESPVGNLLILEIFRDLL